MAKLVNARDLKSLGLNPCEFDSHQWHFMKMIEDNFYEPTDKEKYDYNYDRIFKMKQHEVKMKNYRVLMWEDGEIVVEGKINTIQDLVYITQEFQTAFDSIPFKIDTSEWRGWLGENK